MVTLAHTAESGQTSGTTVTTGNSATGGNAFNAVGIGTGAAVTYDSTALRGSLSFLLTTGGTGATSSLSWTSTAIGTALARVYGRFTVKPGALTASTTLVRLRAAGVQVARISIIATTGVIRVSDTTNGTVQSSSTGMTTSDTWRIAFDFTVGASATGIVYIYRTASSDTPDETLTMNSANWGTANVDECQWGNSTSVANTSLRMDDLVLTSVALPAAPNPSRTT